MNWLAKRLAEPSSYGGIAVALHAVPALIASKGTDGLAWAQVLASLAAFVAPEQKAS